MNYQDAITAWREDKAGFEAAGLILPTVTAVMPPEWRRNAQLAMDAQPGLSTDPNAGVPWFLLNLIDPQVYKVLFAKNKAAVLYVLCRTDALFPPKIAPAVMAATSRY